MNQKRKRKRRKRRKDKSDPARKNFEEIFPGKKVCFFEISNIDEVLNILATKEYKNTSKEVYL